MKADKYYKEDITNKKRHTDIYTTEEPNERASAMKLPPKPIFLTPLKYEKPQSWYLTREDRIIEQAKEAAAEPPQEAVAESRTIHIKEVLTTEVKQEVITESETGKEERTVEEKRKREHSSKVEKKSPIVITLDASEDSEQMEASASVQIPVNKEEGRENKKPKRDTGYASIPSLSDLLDLDEDVFKPPQATSPTKETSKHNILDDTTQPPVPLCDQSTLPIP